MSNPVPDSPQAWDDTGLGASTTPEEVQEHLAK